MYKPFKRLLVENQDKPMHVQCELLDKSIEDWKAYPDPVENLDHFEQIDDILVIGVKLDEEKSIKK